MLKKKNIAILIIGLLTIITIIQHIQIKTLSKEQKVEVGYQQSDYEYKIFYGEWQITEFMGISRYCPGKKQNMYVGDTVYYDSNSIKINNVLVLKEPIYLFGIIPNDKSSIYTMVYPATGGNIVWDEEDGYFTHVRLNQLKNNKEEYFEYGNSFYIVDEETLVLDTDDGWYKMKRLSYIDDYPQVIQRL